MALSEWLDLGRNVLLSGVLGGVVLGLIRVGRAIQKLDTVVEEASGIREELKVFHSDNQDEHKILHIDVGAVREEFGQRLATVEAEIKTVCKRAEK